MLAIQLYLDKVLGPLAKCYGVLEKIACKSRTLPETNGTRVERALTSVTFISTENR